VIVTFVLRGMLLGVIGFSLVIGLIRAQPYQPLATEGLPGDNCQPPCFMGIQTGVTSGSEALRRLSQHPWVTNARRPIDPWIMWDWSGQQPAYIDSRQAGALTVNADRVIAIRVATTLRTGDWLLEWGAPVVMESGSAVQGGLLVLFYSLGFSGPSAYLEGTVRPCAGVDQLWHQPVSMEVRTVYTPWNRRTLDEFMERFHQLRGRYCRR
jgi:hypothetical protein